MRNRARPQAMSSIAAFPASPCWRGSGQVGSGRRFRIRAIESFVGESAPLIYIDGVRVDYAMNSPGIVGPAGPSVLDLVDVSMIERIDVLKGAGALRVRPRPGKRGDPYDHHQGQASRAVGSLPPCGCPNRLASYSEPGGLSYCCT